MKRGMMWGLCALLAVAGCDRGGSSSDSQATATRASGTVKQAKKGPTVQEQTAGMVEAASSGKSAVPVQVKFDLSARPVLGTPLDIDIAVLPQIDANAATIQLTSTDGLDLPPGVNEFAFLTVEAEQVYRHRISLKPTAEGLLVLGLTVTLTHDEVVESRTFSIPIIVDPGRAVAAAQKPPR